MTQLELEQYIQKKVKDGAFFDDIIPAMNSAATIIANKESPLILLTGLLDSDTVTTDTVYDYVDMPYNYLRHLYKVTSALAPTIDIDIYSSRQVMESVCGAATAGYVTGVCVEGKNLLYNGIPLVADTLTTYFYTGPPLFVEGEDNEIIWLPAEFHEKLIGDIAAAKILTDMATDPDYGQERRQLAAERAATLMAGTQASFDDLYRQTHKSRPKQKTVKLSHTRYH